MSISVHFPTRRASSRPILAGLLAAAACGLCEPSPAAYSVVGTNLVGNPAFEEAAPNSPLPAGWNGSAKVYSRDALGGRGGSAALKCANDDPQRYTLCTRTIDLRPGWMFRASVWVKTENVQGPESGATICLEWSDAQGKWLGGTYPSGVRGTRDWTRVESVSRAPAGAKTVRVSCYLRRDMTGTAWFDDVEVVRLAESPLESMLLAPGYRGRITAEGPAEIRLSARINTTDYDDLRPETLRVTARLCDAAGKPLAEKTARPAAGKDEVELALPTRGLAAGKYVCGVELTAADGKRLAAESHALERTPDAFAPRTTFDSRGRFLVEGRPFFPLGIYFSSVAEKELKVYAQSKFNCLMAYGSPTREQMDLAQRYGLKVIYSIKDWYAGSAYCPKQIRSAADEEKAVRERVRAMRDHPALLAWYLNDELPQSFLPQLEAHQRWVADEDPDHPTWAVLYQYREVASYRRTFDVIGTDPYPIGRKPASMAAEWTAETARQVRRARPLWQVPQLHNWANYEKHLPAAKQAHTPSYDEVRSMAWQCIAEGATGLVFYSWYDVRRNPDVPFDVQWSGLQKMAAEIDRFAPILLSAEPAPAVTAEPGAPAWLHWIARRLGDRLYLFAVNEGDGAGQIALRLPPGTRSVRRLGEAPRAAPLSAGRLEDKLEKLEVGVYEALGAW